MIFFFKNLNEMKSNKIILALAFLFIVCSMKLQAQNSGFIGKNNIISLDTRLFSPMLFNFMKKGTSNSYKARDDAFESARNLLSYGGNLSFGRTISNKMAFHVQLSYLKYKTVGLNYLLGGEFANQSVEKSTLFETQSIGFMPIFEFSNAGGITPLGLSNQIGIGFYSNKPIEKPYLVLHSDNSNFITSDETTLFDYKNYKIRTYSFMYKINLRLALSRSVLFNFGMRYNLNITKSSIKYDGTSDDYLYTERQFRQMVRNAQVLNIVSLETGFSFVF